MKTVVIGPLILVCLAVTLPAFIHAAEPSNEITLWPGDAPGETTILPDERNMSKLNDRKVAGKDVIRLGNVSKPTISIYRPQAGKKTGTAVMVCPGGGYNILAMDLEGTEVCDWLNSLGMTAVLLKYRVPRREELEKHVAPLQDAQRAMGIIRQMSPELGVAPNRIGVIGFSAGGHLAATLSSQWKQRSYGKVDSADAVSCRPDFTLLIYPAYLTLKDDFEKLSSEVSITTNHPPTFVVMAQDDPIHVENALTYSLALKRANVPAELHTYPTGGHGYGLRRTEQTITTWPDRATDWFRSLGLLSGIN